MGISSVKPDRATKGYGGIKSNCISAAAAQYKVCDIEMITFEASPYTSLKDLIQHTSSPSSPSSSWLITSPNNAGSRRDSWREIPIKDPLLQHAAWAYLLPMTPDTEGTHTRNLIQKLKDVQCFSGIFGCLNGVVPVIIKSWASFFSPK